MNPMRAWNNLRGCESHVGGNGPGGTGAPAAAACATIAGEAFGPLCAKSGLKKTDASSKTQNNFFIINLFFTN